MNRFGPNSLSDGDGWFRVGTVQVTTTIAAVALATISLVFTAISPALFVEPFWLVWETFRRVQIWRLLTWPFVNPISIWTVLSLAMLFIFGGHLEELLGRQRFAWMMGIMLFVGGVFAAALMSTSAGVQIGDLTIGNSIPIWGTGRLVSGMVIAYALIHPQAKSWFGIPFGFICVVFESLSVLIDVADRNWPGLLLTITIGMTSALLVRAFGVTEFEQIPKVPLPSFVTGDPYQKANRAREKAQRSKQKRQGADVIAMPNAPRRTLEPLDQAYMDVLLDKIGEGGLESLTREERAKLDEYSRRLRDN